MKKLLLALSFLSLMPLASWGQAMELGLTGGISINNPPVGNEYYEAELPVKNPIGSLVFMSNINKHFQLGIEATAVTWANKTESEYVYHGVYIGNDGKKFVYAAPAITFGPVFNIKFQVGIYSYFYMGLAGGGVFTLNKKIKDAKDISGKVDYRAPTNGIGGYGGGQLGWDISLSQRFALNPQITLRYYSVAYSKPDYQEPSLIGTQNQQTGDLAFGTFAYSFQIGFRYLMRYSDDFDFKRRQLTKYGW